MTSSSPKVVDIPNDKVTLHTTIHPSKSGDESSSVESIILLHGGPGVPEEMNELADILTAKFQVINFQQRGTGESSNPSRDYSMEAYISDIDAIANHLGLTKFHLFGQSWGGLYAQIYAQAHPEKLYTLFLSSPSSGTNDLWKETEKEVLAYNQRNSTGWEFLKMGIYSLRGAFGSDRAYQSLFVLVLTAYHRNHAPEVVIDPSSFKPITANPINKTRPKIIEYEALPEIEETTPYRIMMTYGDADIYGPSREKSLARYPNATTEIIKDCGHIPWVHSPTRFETLLKSFYSLE